MDLSFSGNLTPAQRLIWPNADWTTTAFEPINGCQNPGIEICCCQSKGYTLLQITNAGSLQVEVIDLVVNNEFQPAIGLFDLFRFIRFPVSLDSGASFGAVLEMPARIPIDCRYKKAPTSLYVPTNRGFFTFHASKQEGGVA